ncbi:MAG: hypothetical protein LBK66_10770 [Spirochaetaceae bacterium]|jgi:hypothetical protein|nr:hypothetical protein [Spirochaetaceae bacterium]
MEKMKNSILVFAIALLMISCATTSVPYSFVENGNETASIDFIGGNPGIKLIYFDNNELPEPDKKTHWNPVLFPVSKPLKITVHAYYQQQASSGSTGFLGALVTIAATSAITASRAVDRDVLFDCPSLDVGKTYKLVFRKGAGATGKNLLVLTDKSTGKVIYEQEFESK